MNLKNFPLSTELASTAWVDEIHYSWFYEVLKTMNTETQQLFLSLLPPAQSQGVQKMLKVPKKLELSSFAIPFASYVLKAEMQPQEVVSLVELPESKLNGLLRLERKALLQLIDLLGLYDLAADLRQIVDKELLNRIYGALSQSMLHFLHYASKQPMKWISPKLKLDSWDGSSKSLRQLLHKRGLTRLARATADEDMSFKWHLLHHIDTERANVMKKVFSQKYDSSLISYFKAQVLHILKRFES